MFPGMIDLRISMLETKGENFSASLDHSEIYMFLILRYCLVPSVFCFLTSGSSLHPSLRFATAHYVFQIFSTT
jgi:hypothetical protein